MASFYEKLNLLFHINKKIFEFYKFISIKKNGGNIIERNKNRTYKNIFRT